MARARNIKPGFFRNADLVELSFEARLLFIGLWTIADREGRMEDRPKQIKMEIFPADSVDCNAIIDELHRIGMVIRYEVDGSRFIQVTNFIKHQNPHHMEAPSEFPPPPGQANKFNHSPVSPKQRARIYGRDGHKCVLCGCTEHLQIDHIVQVAHGGTSDDDNLRTLCSQCNNKRSKTTKSQANPADSLIPDSLNLIPETTPLVASKLPTCPQQEIIGLYAKHLPTLPQPRVWEGTRAKNLQSRWRWVIADLARRGKPNTPKDALEFFDRMFAYVAASDFLTGRTGAWTGCDLAWICNAENFAKIIEGKYENKEAA